jgi:molybdopterin-guanine dinucleotide biosynthesis protein A
MSITGAILAGGKSKRMGSDKALLSFNGASLIQHVAQTLQQVFEHTIVVSDRPKDYEFLGLPIFPDLFRDCGPLGGIHSAMMHSKTAGVFIASCDTPFISPELVKHICGFAGEGEVKVPIWKNQLHPLCGWYSCSLSGEIQERLEAGELMVQGLLRDIRSLWVPITSDLSFYDERLLVNINDPGEYERLTKSNPVASQNLQ